MEIYKNKSRWKWLLAALGFIILICTMLYSQYLAKNLEAKEKQGVQLYLEAVKSIQSTEGTDSNQRNMNLEFNILENLSDLPIITENEAGTYTGYNYDEKSDKTEDQEFLAERVRAILRNGYEPLEGIGYAHKIYYENSKLYRRIKLFPFVQILLLGTFIFFGYYIFNASRKAEQNRVWAGMAKETAHQLGTPISAIMGWIQYLESDEMSALEKNEIVNELKNDVNRLDLIADRFSKIGSKPELEKINLLEELNDCKVYMQRRAPKKMVFNFPDAAAAPIYANINSHLFDWVIENIIRNALDAMGAVGKIEVDLQVKENMAHIDISDTGKGIDSGKFKTIFEPGYTTKKRGWGLGLSLAKRIIENYHSGKIFVKNSTPNEKTTFSIQLPLA